MINKCLQALGILWGSVTLIAFASPEAAALIAILVTFPTLILVAVMVE